MKISRLETFHADGGWRVASFLKVSTDAGVVGWSEYYDGFGVGGATDVIRRLGDVVVGKDVCEVGPLSATLHALARLAPGGLNHQAIAAIENACLDAKAKALGVPVYALFGGPYRQRIPLYWSHCGYFRALRPALYEGTFGTPPLRTLDDVKTLGRTVAERGYRALKTNPLRFDGERPRAFNPGFVPEPGVFERNWDGYLIGAIKDLLSAFREGAGPDTGLLLDVNFGLRPDGLIQVAKALEPFGMYWLEMDLPDAKALGQVRRATSTPIASLETIYGLGAYRPFFEHAAVDIAIVDVIWNGMLESTRIAALADAFDVTVAPHNFYGDLGAMIGAHFCAAVPNLKIMEFEVDDAPWRHDFVTNPLVVENGEIVLSDKPGWGTDVNEEGLRAHPVRH
jgi:galactonate dehydratase